MKHKLCSLRLTDGNIVVGKLDTTCNEFVTIEEPLAMDFANAPSGGVGLRASLYMPFSEQTIFTFNRKYIILESDVSLEFAVYYHKFMEEIDTSSHDSIINKKDIN
jgi:hypothetical protein